MSFEGFVRPFQLPNAAPPTRYVAAKQQSQPPIMLYFGRGGSGITIGGSFSKTVERYMDQKVVEDRRALGFSYSNVPFPSQAFQFPNM